MTFVADAKAKPETLNWWMWAVTEQPATEHERAERARLMLLILRTWDEARKPANKNKWPIDLGLMANDLCAHMVDAATEQIGCDRQTALETLDRWANSPNPDVLITGFFTNVWNR